MITGIYSTVCNFRKLFRKYWQADGRMLSIAAIATESADLINIVYRLKVVFFLSYIGTIDACLSPGISAIHIFNIVLFLCYIFKSSGVHTMRSILLS